jgi:hypothetical protein
MIVIDEKFLVIKEINGYLVDMILINSFRSGSDLIDSSLDILTVDEKLLVFKEIKIIVTRYDFDQLFPVGGWESSLENLNTSCCTHTLH